MPRERKAQPPDQNGHQPINLEPAETPDDEPVADEIFTTDQGPEAEATETPEPVEVEAGQSAGGEEPPEEPPTSQGPEEGPEDDGEEDQPWWRGPEGVAFLGDILPVLGELMDKKLDGFAAQFSAEAVDQKIAAKTDEMLEAVKELLSDTPDIPTLVNQAIDEKFRSLSQQVSGASASTNGNDGNGATVAHAPSNGAASQEGGEDLKTTVIREAMPYLFRQFTGGGQQAQAGQGNPMSSIDQIKTMMETFYGLQSALIQPIRDAEENAYQRMRREFDLKSRAGMDPLEFTPTPQPAAPAHSEPAPAATGQPA